MDAQHDEIQALCWNAAMAYVAAAHSKGLKWMQWPWHQDTMAEAQSFGLMKAPVLQGRPLNVHQWRVLTFCEDRPLPRPFLGSSSSSSSELSSEYSSRRDTFLRLGAGAGEGFAGRGGYVRTWACTQSAGGETYRPGFIICCCNSVVLIAGCLPCMSHQRCRSPAETFIMPCCRGS